jgi:hypothetical protein
MPARVCQISACSVSVRPAEMDTMDTTSLRGNCVQPAGNEERGEGRRRRGGENGKVSQRESALLPLSLVLRRVSERGRPLCLSFPREVITEPSSRGNSGEACATNTRRG